MLSKNVLHSLKKGLNIKKYPTVGRNGHIFRLAYQALPYYLSPRSGFAFPPLSVFIQVNASCNLKCKMCDAGQEDQASMFYKNLKGEFAGDMPLDAFKHIIDKVKGFKPFIGIPALEPLLYPHIAEAISYIHSQGLNCSVATNGYFLEEASEDLVTSGLTKIVISLDGTPSVHDEIRGSKGTYERVLNGIKRLDLVKKKTNSETPYIFVNYVISTDNYDCIREFVKDMPLDMITQIDFRMMFFCTKELAEKHNKAFGDKYDATVACLAGGIDLSKLDTDILYEQITDVTRRYDKCKLFFNHGKEGLYRYYHEPEVFLDGTNCVFPWYTLQISNNGEVIPPQRCYHIVFGNILEEDFETVWNGDRMREFRTDLRKYGRFPACTRCEGVNF